MNDGNQQQPEQSQQQSLRRGRIIFSILGGLLFLAIILAIVLPKGKTNKPDDSDVIIKDGSSVFQMTPISQGEFTYDFDGIEWVFDTTEQGGARVPETQVAFFLDNFSRRDGSPVRFNNPYRLGLYQGTCGTVEILEKIDNTEITPLSFVRCQWENSISEIALFQDGVNVIAKNRRYEVDKKIPDLTETYSIDMTTIVQ